MDDSFVANYLLAFDTRDIGDRRPGVNLDLLASSLDMSEFWAYSGSTTSPPCTEISQWAVAKKVRPLSQAQLTRFQETLKADASSIGNVDAGAGNNRATQPINGRPIYSVGFGTPQAAPGGAVSAVTGTAASETDEDTASSLLTAVLISTFAAFSLAF